MVVIGLYSITLIVSIFSTLSLILRNKRVDSRFILFAFFVIINSLGRLMVAMSTTLETAYWGVKIMYAGAIFCPLTVLFCVFQFCEIKCPKVVYYGLTGFSLLIFYLVLTIGVSPVYYVDMQLAYGDGYTYLIKEYGPAHKLYTYLVIAYAITLAVTIGYVFIKRKILSARTIITITGLALAIILSYGLERIFHSKISYVSLGYLVVMIMLTHITERFNMYDMSVNIVNSVERMQEYAYIEFDNQYRYVGSNSKAKQLFNDIGTKWVMDNKIEPDDSFFYKNVFSWMLERSDEDKKIIPIGDEYYEMYVRNISYLNRGKVGYLLEFIDRTAEVQNLENTKNYNINLERQVKEKTAHISQIKDMMVLGMASMVESRDNSTGGHIKRTSACMKVFSDNLLCHTEELGIDRAFLDKIVRAAPMHDLGKIAVDDRVLRKNGKYTDDEYNEMKKHSLEGARIVEGILRGVEDDDFVELARNVAHYHHEKWNGRGYPTGLSGRAIPLEARIMALVDVFDALVSKRCYKEAFSYDKAFEIIEQSSGTHFDPHLCGYFLECRPQLEKLYDNWDRNNF